MFAVSQWDLNKEVFVNAALVKFKETSGHQGGYDILRYAAKGVLSCAEYTTGDLKCWKYLKLGYVILGLAKEGKIKFAA